MVEGLICCMWFDDVFEWIVYMQGCLVLDGDEVCIVDVIGVLVVFGEIGELQVCGLYMICGYYWFVVYDVMVFMVDGFYCSGDCVWCIVDGDLVVEGCDKDQINCGGEKVLVEEVENLLFVYLQVYDVVVVVMFDLMFGEWICVFVVVCVFVLF